MSHTLLRFHCWLLLLSCLLLSACTPVVTSTPIVSLRPTSSPVAASRFTPAAATPSDHMVVLATSTPVMRAAQSQAPAPPVEAQQNDAPTSQPQNLAAPVLRINVEWYPDTLDPQKSAYVTEIATLRMIYEGLTRLNEKLETVPAATESWTYNADATEVTFKLRPDLKYSDGTVLNAKRFEYALIRNSDPDTAGEYAYVTDDILGAVEWRDFVCEGQVCTAAENEAMAKAEETLRASVQALDATGALCTDYNQADCLTLKIKFAKPVPYFHTIMSMWVTYPAKEEYMSAGGDLWWNSSVYQVGNGPFVLQVVEPQVRHYFVPNGNYWGNRPQYDVEFRYIDDPALALRMYQNNEFDIITLNAEMVDAINADLDLRVDQRIYPSRCTMMFAFNWMPEITTLDGQTYPSPFQDKKVREAFAYAFDAKAWVSEIEQGLSFPASTWIPLGYPGYAGPDITEASRPLPWFPQRFPAQTFDPEKARAALAESSYGGPEKFNQLRLALIFSDTPRNRQRFGWLVENYKKHLGIDLVLEPQEPFYGTRLTPPDNRYAPILMRLGWCADYPDPQNWLSVYWKTGGYSSRYNYSNPAFDELITRADIETNPQRRLQLYQDAQRLLLEDIPAIFTSHTANHYLVKPWVKGILHTPEDDVWPGSLLPASISIDLAERAGAVIASPRPPLAIVPTATPRPVSALVATPIFDPPDHESPLPRLTINIGDYPYMLDPQQSWGTAEELATLRLIYEGLTRLNEKLETVPAAAESWTYNADATELTFKLRPDLRYSDGTLLNAKRFEYALIRNIDPATNSEYAALTDEIVGAAEWRAADVAADDYDPYSYISALGVKALDANGRPCQDYEYEVSDCLTLQIKLRRPAPYFHTIMSTWVAYPAKQENIEEGGENWWSSSKYQIGNGPFLLDVAEPYVRQVLRPNFNYWGRQPQYTVAFSYVTDPAVALEAYKNDELDIIATDVSQLTVINADTNLKAQHLVYPGSCTAVIKFNLGEYVASDGQLFTSPFQDKKVREAFSYAFDAEDWVKEIDSGLTVPVTAWIPSGYPDYDAGEANLKFDPEKARTALAQSSYQGSEGLNKLGLKLTFSDTPYNRQRAEWLVENYKTHLGVELSLDPVEGTTLTVLLYQGTPLLTHRLWCAAYPDPYAWLSQYWKDDIDRAGHQGYKNDQFDRLIQEADAETNPTLRMERYRQAQRLLIQDVPAIFVSHTTNHYLVKPWVKDVVQTPEDGAWPGSIVPASITIERSSQ